MSTEGAGHFPEREAVQDLAVMLAANRLQGALAEHAEALRRLSQTLGFFPCRRERIAVAILAALVGHHGQGARGDALARQALGLADELIAALDGRGSR